MKTIQKRILLDEALASRNTDADVPAACDLVISQSILAEALAVAKVMKSGFYHVCAGGFKGYDDNGDEMLDMNWSPAGIDLVLRNYSSMDDGSLVLTVKVFNKDTDAEYLLSKHEIVLTKAEIDEVLGEDEEGMFEVSATTTITRESIIVTGKPSQIEKDSVLIDRLCNNKEVDCDTVLHLVKVKP